jgi:Uma2 family endonuclease
MTAPTATGKRLYDADEFLCMPDGNKYELDDGDLVSLDMGAEANQIAGKMFSALLRVTENDPIGVPFPAECGLRIFPGRPARVPKPDGGFIASGKLPGDRLPKGFIEVVPDIVWEVVSPDDNAIYTERKVREYLGVGIRLVWVVYPETRTVHVFRADGTVSVIEAGGAISGEDVCPGFELPLARILPPAE